MRNGSNCPLLRGAGSWFLQGTSVRLLSSISNLSCLSATLLVGTCSNLSVMATGGWGAAYSSNPFAAQAATAAAEQAAEKAAAHRPSQAYGAWGAGVGSSGAAAAAPTAPSAPAYAFNNNGTTAAAGGGPVDAREAALQRREAELSRREAQLAAAGAGGAIRNWPSCCPFLYHNIKEQIPSWSRSFVRFTYFVELISIAGFFYNTIITLAALFAGAFVLQWWFLSLLVLVIGVPLSWWLFYKSVFNSAQTDGATYSYMRTFILIIVHLAWCVWMILALPNLGQFSAGVFPMLDSFKRGDSKGIAFGIMFIINIALWGLAGFGCWVVLGLAVAAYRKGDQPRRDAEERYGGIQMNQA
eukprot:GHRR01033247.1.p1 GENE.GHRR01033247.1~~GHRR01033247.1.p1  ORF type:complete len:356 (+),score=123.81 GHRR01033247.1:287-1354(+)